MNCFVGRHKNLKRIYNLQNTMEEVKQRFNILFWTLKKSWPLNFDSLSLQSQKWAEQYSVNYFRNFCSSSKYDYFLHGTALDIKYTLHFLHQVTEIFWKKNHINKSSVSKLLD